jgi:hypothetical protein
MVNMMVLKKISKHLDAWSVNRRPGRIISILGMHRSGTSCLTGTLQAAGLVLGKYHSSNKYNPKGNRENQDVIDLHQRLLKDNQGSWTNPPASEKWHNKHKRQARKILSEYTNVKVWGFKDPRTLLFLDGWLELVPDMEFIGIFRHPIVVARSLHARETFPITVQDGLELWKHYNQCLLTQYTKSPFPMLSFDWSEDLFHGKVNQVVEKLGLNPVSEGNRFYSREIHKHHIKGDEELPTEIGVLYEKLKAISM